MEGSKGEKSILQYVTIDVIELKVIFVDSFFFVTVNWSLSPSVSMCKVAQASVPSPVFGTLSAMHVSHVSHRNDYTTSWILLVVHKIRVYHWRWCWWWLESCLLKEPFSSSTFSQCLKLACLCIIPCIFRSWYS